MKALIGTAVWLIAVAASGHAQSLLKDNASPYDPPRPPALRVHDHVRIVFEDRSKPAATAPESRPRWDAELRQWIRADAKEIPAAAAVLTAEVADIRPNGTLVLQAVVRRSLNQETETLKFMGEIAADRITPTGASSENLANVTLVYEGAAGDAAKPGLLGWIFGKLWPF